MAHSTQHVLRTVFVALVGLSACGRVSQEEFLDLRRGQEDSAADANPATPPTAEAPNSNNSPETISAEPAAPIATPPLFDRRKARSTPGGYYQRDLALADLFADKATSVAGESLLCWPAAMAFEVHYQSRLRTSPLHLKQALGSFQQALPAEQIRKLANFCGFEKNRGTNVPEAVKCLNKLYESQGYKKSHIQVIGVDAQWKAFGLFPASTETANRKIRAEDIMAAIDRDQSIVMLLGFYEKDSSGKWERRTGHFASITGYDYRTAWSGKELQLHVVNPAVDYLERQDGVGFDRIRMQTTANSPSLPTPDMTSYVLEGSGFEYQGHVAILESLILFSASTN